MIDYAPAVLLGLAGSVHCAGMCGPLVLALPSADRTGPAFFLGRMAYNTGRILTYCALGLVFGLVGRTFVMAGIQRWVSIGLGSVLLIGLLLSSRVRFWTPLLLVLENLKSLMRATLRKRSILSLGLLGVLNGALPCGLVYVACAGATSTGSPVSGALFMAMFGLGTIPIMLALGLWGAVIPTKTRLRFRALVPFSICIVAALLILRGLSLGIPYISPVLGGSCCH